MSVKTKWRSFILGIVILQLSIQLELVGGQNDYDDYEYSEDYFESNSHRKKYNGKYIGKLNSYHHQVNGQIYAVNEKTLLFCQHQLSKFSAFLILSGLQLMCFQFLENL